MKKFICSHHLDSASLNAKIIIELIWLADEMSQQGTVIAQSDTWVCSQKAHGRKREQLPFDMYTHTITYMHTHIHKHLHMYIINIHTHTHMYSFAHMHTHMNMI